MEIEKKKTFAGELRQSCNLFAEWISAFRSYTFVSLEF